MKKLRFLFLLGSFVAATFLSPGLRAQTPVVFSDPGGFGSNGSGTTYDGGPTLPFDSKLSIILLSSGLIYVSRFLDKKKLQFAY